MVNKTYIVCDMHQIFEQANEDVVVYMRKVSSADVQPVRIAQRKYQTFVKKNSINLGKELKKLNRRKNKKSLEQHLNELTAGLADQFSSKGREMERGEFAGLYLVHEADPTLPENGFTYEQIPEEWEYLGEEPTRLLGSETTLGEFLKERWWNLDK